VLVAALVGMVGGGFLAAPQILEAALFVRQRLAMGDLEWRSPTGWVAVDRADARRRTWGPSFFGVDWEEVAAGLDEGELHLRRPPNPLEVNVLLLRVDPSFWRFRVWGRADFSRGPVSALAAEAGLSVAMNASYFSEEGPLGLVVSDGAVRGRQGTSRAAHFVVPVGGAPRIVNEKNAKLGPLQQGFQGFPSIMTAGETYGYMRWGGRGFDVYAVDRRSAACVLADGVVILLVTDTLTNGLSLSELATVFGGLGCRDAMAFDGGSSTGISVRVPGHLREVPNLEGVPVVLGLEAAR
jgi:hypothetical protein